MFIKALKKIFIVLSSGVVETLNLSQNINVFKLLRRLFINLIYHEIIYTVTIHSIYTLIHYIDTRYFMRHIYMLALTYTLYLIHCNIL